MKFRPKPSRNRAVECYILIRYIYMVDTLQEKEADDDKDKPVGKPPKRRRQKRRPRSGKGNNVNIVTNNDNNPDQAEDPTDPALEQDKQEDGDHSPGLLSDHNDVEDINYQPISE